MSKMKQVLEAIIAQGYTIDDKGVVRNPEGTIIAGSMHEGYKKFSVRTNFTSSYAMRHHKFQAYMKFGDEIFKKGSTIKHINGNTDDNSYDNISVGAKTVGKSIKREVEFTDEIKSGILADREAGVSYRKLVDKYGIPKSTIMDFVNKTQQSLSSQP